MDIKFIKTWNPSIYRKLVKCGLTSPLNILLLNSLELQEILKISQNETQDLKSQLTTSTTSKFQLGDVSSNRLSTGCIQIDNIIKGGFPISNIIELYGSASAGKTQFCLQLLLMVQLPVELGGFNKAAVYISTVKKFPSIRFRQLCQQALKKYKLLDFNFEDNVYIRHCRDLEELFICLNVFLPKLLENILIGLIVVDSIAGIFHGNKDLTNYKERTLHFSRITTQVRTLAKAHNAVIIFVNEVIDNLHTGETEAALGLAWHNLVVQQFKISKQSTLKSHREFQIIKSYELPLASAKFSINLDGLQ